MTTSRITAVAITLSIAFGLVGAGSTQPSAKDQSLSGTVASTKRMADARQHLTAESSAQGLAVLLHSRT